MSRAVNLRHSVSQDGAVAYNERGNAVYACGDTVPADGTAGYEVGCQFIDTNGADGAVWYVNEGTADSCDFNPTLGGVIGRLVKIADATSYSVLAANSGKTHVILEQAANITLTLPAAAAGLEYTFVMGGFATEAQNWIFDTGSAAAFYLGGLAFTDLDAGAAADEVHAGVYPDGNSNDVMTIITPAAGTRIHLVCDGTNWFVNGIVVSATVPTFAD